MTALSYKTTMDQQAEFEHTGSVIRAHYSRLIQEKNDKEDLTHLFFTILPELGEQRHHLAEKNGIENNFFGITRELSINNPDKHFYRFITTALGKDSYLKYNRLFIERVTLLLSDLNLNDLNSCVRVSTQEDIAGYTIKFELEILEDDFYKKEVVQSTKHIEAAAELIGLDSISFEQFFCFLKNIPPNLFLFLQENHPELFMKIRMRDEFMATIISKITTLHHEGDPKYTYTHHIYAKTTISYEDKTHELSRYYLWLDTTNESPIEAMKEHNIAIILHQDASLIPISLEKISDLFKRAIQWNKSIESTDELIHDVGMFRYLFAHVMPFYRGSATIGEWLESIIYQYHGFTQFSHNKEKPADLEALTATNLSQFLSAYPETMQLEASS